MHSHDTEPLILLPPDEQQTRLNRLRDLMTESGTEAAVISSNTNIYYLTGRVYCGCIIVPADSHPVYAVRRPVHLADPYAVAFRKIEELPALTGLKASSIALEMGAETYNSIRRMQKAFGDTVRYSDASALLAAARSVKTSYELDKIRESGIRQTELYRRIPRLYRPGMRDIDLQIAIEREARTEGCLGQFRIGGNDMELFMGSILAGDNADAPSPYDFAMGGAGLDPSLPVGADGTLIRQGESVMVDVNGNFTGYMTDMTRCFTLRGELPELARRAHSTSIDICNAFACNATEGAEAKALYEAAAATVRDAGLEHYFMGHRQHAGFAGHGLGIEINELPVIAPRSKAVLQAGNVIALEPKFVIPGVGAVGIENTYIVRDGGREAECVTHAPTGILTFE